MEAQDEQYNGGGYNNYGHQQQGEWNGQQGYDGQQQGYAHQQGYPQHGAEGQYENQGEYQHQQYPPVEGAADPFGNAPPPPPAQYPEHAAHEHAEAPKPEGFDPYGHPATPYEEQQQQQAGFPQEASHDANPASEDPFSNQGSHNYHEGEGQGQGQGQGEQKAFEEPVGGGDVGGMPPPPPPAADVGAPAEAAAQQELGTPVEAAVATPVQSGSGEFSQYLQEVNGMVIVEWQVNTKKKNNKQSVCKSACVCWRSRRRPGSGKYVVPHPSIKVAAKI